MRSRQTSTGVVLIAALCLFSLASLADEVLTVEHDRFTVVHMASLPAEGVNEVTKRVDSAIRRISAWLSQAESWTGPIGDGHVRVLIDPDSGTPAQLRQSIFVPEHRVRQAVANNTLADGDFGIVHEVSHVYAVSAFRGDRNRFYDDGLAVFLQHRFGPSSNYPSYGIELHVATAELAKEAGALIPFAEANQAKRVTDDPQRRRLGYLQLGSFTQYLIDNYGVDAYFEIYSGKDIEVVTTSTLDELETRWQALITSIQ